MANLVYYSQEDLRWRNIMYSSHGDKNQTIGTSGCGPTSAAMALSSLGHLILPTEAAAYAVSKGYRTYDRGTAWGFFANIAKQFGVAVTQTGSIDLVKSELMNGNLVVASMGKGHFTGAGHFILLVGCNIKNGIAWIDVHDPNMDNRKYGADGLIDQGIRNDGKVSSKEAVFKMEANQYWIFHREVDEMTAVQYAELMEKVSTLASKCEAQEARIRELEERENMACPSWATDAVAAAVKSKLIDTPKSGSYTFYRFITIMHRLGLY